MPSEPMQPPSGDVTPGEAWRLAAANTQVVNQLAARLDGLLDRMDTLYQRRDVAEAMAANQSARVADLTEDVKGLDARFQSEVQRVQAREEAQDKESRRLSENREKEARATRRWLVGAFVGPIVTAVIAALILAVIFQ